MWCFFEKLSNNLFYVLLLLMKRKSSLTPSSSSSLLILWKKKLEIKSNYVAHDREGSSLSRIKSQLLFIAIASSCFSLSLDNIIFFFVSNIIRQHHHITAVAANLTRKNMQNIYFFKWFAINTSVSRSRKGRRGKKIMNFIDLLCQ